MVSVPMFPYVSERGPAPSHAIIACDLRRNHRGKGRNVLYADGKVRWLTEDRFREELGRPENADFGRGLSIYAENPESHDR